MGKKGFVVAVVAMIAIILAVGCFTVANDLKNGTK